MIYAEIKELGSKAFPWRVRFYCDAGEWIDQNYKKRDGCLVLLASKDFTPMSETFFYNKTK